MADKRAFAVLDVGYFENPKMMDVLDASSIALSMHIASILYCSQHLTDGFVSTKAMQRKVGGSLADTEILIDAGLWHMPGHGCDSCPEVPDGKAYVHDYLEHNRSSEGSKRTSKKAKDAADARWAKRKMEQKADAKSDAPGNAPSNAVSNAPSIDFDMPDAMHRQTDRQNLKDSSKEFDQWYLAYPRKEAKAAARKAFVKARKTVDFQTLIDGVVRYSKATQGKDREFIALPATWLNAGRWDDETPAATPLNSPWTKEFHQ